MFEVRSLGLNFNPAVYRWGIRYNWRVSQWPLVIDRMGAQQKARVVADSDLRSSPKRPLNERALARSAVSIQRQETRMVVIQGLNAHQILKPCNLLVRTGDRTRQLNNTAIDR